MRSRKRLEVDFLVIIGGTMKWFVSRQSYWGVDPENTYVVEIAYGGRDYANPDMLRTQYAGEGKEYEDPREAVAVALEIAKKWRSNEPDKNISVACGFTGGATLPFELEKGDFDTVAASLRKWAEEEYDQLPKCEQCGNLLPEEYFTDESGKLKFCQEYCAEKWCAECEESNC